MLHLETRGRAMRRSAPFPRIRRPTGVIPRARARSQGRPGGQAALRWLDKGTPDLRAARRSVERVIKDGKRAGDVIGRIRDLITKAPPRRDNFDINAAIQEVVALTSAEAVQNGVSVHTAFAVGLPSIQGDRVELQQVILNLIINALEAMSNVSGAARELLISTARVEANRVLVTVRDSGPGLASATFDRLYESFYTTKPGGLGLGLSICRSIIEAHGGQLWATANPLARAPHKGSLRLSHQITIAAMSTPARKLWKRGRWPKAQATAPILDSTRS
jgi:signal transduction histidine kinase